MHEACSTELRALLTRVNAERVSPFTHVIAFAEACERFHLQYMFIMQIMSASVSNLSIWACIPS